MKVFVKGAALAAAASLLFAGSANAALVFGFAGGGDAPLGADVLLYDFTDGSLAFLDSYSNTIVQGGSNGDGAQNPFSLPGGNYMSIKGGGEAALTFDKLMKSVSFNWGSRDTYNTLTIHWSGGTQSVIPAPGSGDQGSASTNGVFYAFVDNGNEHITGLTFGSSGNSFEVDDISGSAVPEPATWAMMIAGFGLAGTAIRRRRAAFAVA